MLLGAIFFILLILLHELGHFIAARRNGVEVEEFAFGFPPKLFAKTMGRGMWRTKYSFNLLPIGGFVRLKGENESDKRKGSFGAASTKVKTKIALAGVAMNALIAVLIFTYQAATGMPQFYEGQYRLDSAVSQVTSRVSLSAVDVGSPAASTKLEHGDIIVGVGGIAVSNIDKLDSALAIKNGQTVKLQYLHDGAMVTEYVSLNQQGSSKPILGVAPFDLVEVKHQLWSAPIVGVATTVQLGALTLQGFGTSIWNLFHGHFGQASENIVGPVGIFSYFSALSALGLSYILFFAAILSVALAVINILPLPALDGGRLLMSYLTKTLKLKVNRRREELIHFGGFVALLILAILVTFIDIKNLG